MVLKPVAFGDSALTVLITNLKQAKQNLQLFSIKKASHSSHPQFPTHYKLFFYLTNKINLACFLPSLSVSMERAEGGKAHQAAAGLFAAPGLAGCELLW